MALLPFEYTNYIAVQENKSNEALEWWASIVVKNAYKISWSCGSAKTSKYNFMKARNPVCVATLDTPRVQEYQCSFYPLNWTLTE